MPGLLTALRVGVSTGLGSFRRAYFNPAIVEGGATISQWGDYGHRWALYEGSAFEDVAQWGPYKGRYRLYRQTRLLYNPAHRLAEMYAGHVYPGIVTADETAVPEGTTLAIPLSEDTTPQMRAALDQLFAWSRWQVNKSVMCRYGAVGGNVLVEAVDRLDERRVQMNIVWPSLVAYPDLDSVGVIKAYALQYPARDDNGMGYEFRKEVDIQEIRYYKNGILHDYGEGASYPNPYGFVPAVWIKHKDLGGNDGAPAFHGALGKIDELNSLGSHISDQIHKVIGAPIVLWSDGAPSNLFGPKAQTKGAPTNPYDMTDLDREGVLMLKGPKDGRVDHLAGQLQLHEALEHMQMLQTEIESDFPEITMYRQLRAMSQVTGPAATRLMGDVVAAVGEASANYDEGSQRVFAMGLAIAGWRAKRGDWGALTAEQALFTPFDLDQYHAEVLRIRLLPRALISMSEQEKLALQQLRDSVKAGVPATLTANLRETIAG